MGMVELSPSLREGREVTSGEGRRHASDNSKRTMTKKSPTPFTTNRARSLLAERLQIRPTEGLSLFQFTYDDFTLTDYNPYPHIKATVAV